MSDSGILLRVAAAAIVIVSSTGCAAWRNWRGGDLHDAGAPDAGPVVVEAEASSGDIETALRDAVASYVRSENSLRDEKKSRVIYRSPYYFKEYNEYLEAPADADVLIKESESKTTPYTADVTLRKHRFATRMHRERGEAISDGNFLRDTGVETLTFELRAGRWQKAGSLYVAERTEENVNGEWVAVEEKVQRTIAAEEAASDTWFSRVWSTVTGRKDEPAPRATNTGTQTKQGQRRQMFGN